MPKISFFLRSSTDSVEATVFCRVTFNNSKKEFSLKEKVSKSDWCAKSQRLKKKSSQKKYLDHLQETISYKLKTFSLSNENATAMELIQSIQPAPKVKTILLSEICEMYVSAVSSSVAPGTIRNHNFKIGNLKKFEAVNKCNYTADDFTIKIAHTFIDWFQTINNTDNKTSANRNVLFYAKSVKWYRNKGNKVESDLFHFQGEKDALKSPIFLTFEELKQIEEITFVSSMLNRIKDLFLFQCYTGLSYCDVWGNWELKREEFGTILTGTRGKNAQLFFLPVEYEKVTEIINRYNGELPRYCNGTYNRILKEIALICDFNKRITTHTGRKTFATLMDANGWSRETVSKMLGHKSVRTTELYYLGECVTRIELEMKQRNEMKNAV